MKAATTSSTHTTYVHNTRLQPLMNQKENRNVTTYPPIVSKDIAELVFSSYKAPTYNFAFSSTFNCPLAHIAPPSIAIVAPFTCAPALLARYTTTPAISSGLPSLFIGFAAAMLSLPPLISNKPLLILVGKKPGQMLFTVICLGPSSTARFLPK